MTNQELERAIQEIWAMFRETDRRLEKRFRETDRRLEERFKETDRQIRELGKQIGGLGNKFGGFTEGMAFPSMKRILIEEFGMKCVSPRVEVRRDGEVMEIDVLAYSDDGKREVYVVEVKSHLREEDIEKMLGDLRRFRRFFPEHGDKALYGIIAAVDIPEDLRARVLNSGLYLAQIKDDTFELVVPQGFKAKSFN